MECVINVKSFKVGFVLIVLYVGVVQSMGLCEHATTFPCGHEKEFKGVQKCYDNPRATGIKLSSPTTVSSAVLKEETIHPVTTGNPRTDLFTAEISSSDPTTRHMCPPNMVEGNCTCEGTCKDPTGCSRNCTLFPTCSCPEGFLMSINDDCVPEEQCGCFIEVVGVIADGQLYVDDNCSTNCDCHDDYLNCNHDYRCGSNATCWAVDSVMGCYCNVGNITDNPICEKFADCQDAYEAGHTEDDIYTILPRGWQGSPFNVLCSMTVGGGGWTVIQRRINGSENFERNWNEYKNGFGSLSYDFWLGNDRIHYLTTQKTYSIRMDFVNIEGVPYFATYLIFYIGNEDSKYELTVMEFSASSSTDVNAFDEHNRQLFSTPDHDNDKSYFLSCAKSQRSGWWYKACDDCDFNRPFLGDDVAFLSPVWEGLPGSNYLKYVDMKIRPS